MKNLAVFVSGSGTNMENIAVHIEQKKLTNCQIMLVVCDQPKALALERAKKHGLKSVVIQQEKFKSKTDFEIEILNQLNEHQIDYIVLAGFMKILGRRILEKYQWKIINIHPALLPKFPGAHAIRDTWEANVKETGVTVHFVDEGIDTGPTIQQEKVARAPSDTLEIFEQKIHQVEYKLYPKVIQWLVDGELEVRGREVYRDGKRLTTLVE